MAAASSQTATKPESKEIKQNTWETLLKRATQRTVYEDSTLIVLGIHELKAQNLRLICGR
eukprot:801445-Amorphochlora_amoeboformis.AAC.2